MTDVSATTPAAPTLAQSADRPSPASALEAAFRTILQHQMRDVPMVNPALAVEAVGFRPWNDHWLGILITPWFMNLVLMPRVADKWLPIADGESRHYIFPAGVFEFIGGRAPALGDYQACSLFSPMFEFANHGGARDTAVAALDALFDGTNREAGEVAHAPAVPASPAPARTPHALSKRDFLFGLPPRDDRGP
jgi:[NiFe] hydrogenase assembly HybE family chaperone